MVKPDNSDRSLASAHEGDICTIFKYAPLMDPIVLVVKGVHTSIRVAEASRIVVERCNGLVDGGAQ